MSFMTCSSDASFCAKTGVCGWGAWAIRNEWDGRGRFYGGTARDALGTVNEAELAGIRGVLQSVIADESFVGVRGLMVQCDNTGALMALLRVIPGSEWSASGADRDVKALGTRVVLAPRERRLCDEIASLIGERRLYLRHVKGHSGERGGRGWVNSQCDAEARRNMLAGRRAA